MTNNALRSRIAALSASIQRDKLLPLLVFSVANAEKDAVCQVLRETHAELHRLEGHQEPCTSPAMIIAMPDRNATGEEVDGVPYLEHEVHAIEPWHPGTGH